MVLEFRRYRDGDEVGIVETMNSAFETFRQWGLTSDIWLELTRRDYGFRRDLALVAEEDGKIVGHVQLVLRKLRYGCAVFTTGGIANVSTRPEHRGRGIATRLMSLAVETCREEGIPISSLWTGFLSPAHHIYRKLGYVDTFSPYSFGAHFLEVKEALKLLGGNGVEVRELQSADLDEIRKIYALFTEGWIGPGVRDAEYVRNKFTDKQFYHTFFYDEPENFVRLVSVDGGKVTGYVIAAFGGKLSRRYGDPYAGSVLEAIALDEKSLRCLMHSALQELLEAGAKKVWVNAPDIPLYRRLLPEFRKVGGQGTYMDKIIDLPALLEQVKSELERRLIERGVSVSTSIKLAVDSGSAVLKIEDDSITVSREGSSPSYISLSDRNFLKMFYGVESFEELLQRRAVRSLKLASGMELEILSTLFPKNLFYVWPLDHW